MKIFRKLTKIIIFALAVFMIIGGCAFNKNNNTAFAEVSTEETENGRYYFEIPSGTVFKPLQDTEINSDTFSYFNFVFTFNEINTNYYYPVILDFGATTVNYSPSVIPCSYDTQTSYFAINKTLRVYLDGNIIDRLNNISFLTVSNLIIKNAWINYEYTSDYFNNSIYIMFDNTAYQNGFANGYEEGGINQTVGLLTGVYNIDLEFYANDVPGVVATVNNATKHYTPGGLSFSPYNEEYGSVITSYQPEFPENFIERCDVILSLDGVPLVETLTNDYEIQNFVLNYPTTLINVARPTIALEFDFDGEFTPFSLELVKGLGQDYLTISASDLTPYINRNITGIKITYYDRDIFSFYEPNALLTIDNLSATKDLIYGASTGYGNGYVNGYNNGFTDGEQGAIDGGYDNAGIFAGAVAFLRLFFQLFGGLLERKIIGDLTFGLFIIGIPATVMIVDLVISLVRKFLGKSGGGE